MNREEWNKECVNILVEHFNFDRSTATYIAESMDFHFNCGSLPFHAVEDRLSYWHDGEIDE